MWTPTECHGLLACLPACLPVVPASAGLLAPGACLCRPGTWEQTGTTALWHCSLRSLQCQRSRYGHSPCVLTLLHPCRSGDVPACEEDKERVCPAALGCSRPRPSRDPDPANTGSPQHGLKITGCAARRAEPGYLKAAASVPHPSQPAAESVAPARQPGEHGRAVVRTYPSSPRQAVRGFLCVTRAAAGHEAHHTASSLRRPLKVTLPAPWKYGDEYPRALVPLPPAPIPEYAPPHPDHGHARPHRPPSVLRHRRPRHLQDGRTAEGRLMHPQGDASPTSHHPTQPCAPPRPHATSPPLQQHPSPGQVHLGQQYARGALQLPSCSDALNVWGRISSRVSTNATEKDTAGYNSLSFTILHHIPCTPPPCPFPPLLPIPPPPATPTAKTPTPPPTQATTSACYQELFKLDGMQWWELFKGSTYT
ncbi:formin-like protein 20 [Portunus trituberculatus]|uniref:formin-like protein 20 n=1 Tax=Portunus trituberculatus TaxID=210409 RepID=UPI001E1CF315|nr:formin-like protein 20 [Portunus trituberculatus]